MAARLTPNAPRSDWPQILAAYQAGEPPQSLIERFGCSLSGLHQARHRAGLPPQREAWKTARHKHWTRPEEKELRRLYEGGALLSVIADHLGRSYASVQSHARILKLKRPIKIAKEHASRARLWCWSEAQDRTLRQLYAMGKSFAEMGKILGRTRGSIGQRCSKLGLSRRKLKRAA